MKDTSITAFVIGFAKKGLPHTFDLPTLTIHKFRLIKAIDLEID